MKKRLLAAIIAAVIMIAIPLLSVKSTAFNDIKKLFSSVREIKQNKLTGYMAYYFRKGYRGESLKAIALILNTNYKAKIKLKSLSKEKFLKKYKNGSIYYSELENTARDFKNKYIAYKNKPARIPFCSISSGACETDRPYIRKTSNPWDLLSKKYNKKAKSNVSFNSINELCKNGLSYKQALGRYLKGVKITASK